MQKENSINVHHLLTKINHKIIIPNDQTVAIYTTLRIIERMKKEIGLEVTLEYLEHYIAEVERNIPPIKKTTDYILQFINIRKIFQELME